MCVNGSWAISYTTWQHFFMVTLAVALVTVAVVPLIAEIGGIHTTTLAKLSSKSQIAISKDGNIAEQVSHYHQIFFYIFLNCLKN